jgi:hypothetical protein
MNICELWAFSTLQTVKIPYFFGVLGVTVIINIVACRLTKIAHSTEEQYV